MTGTNAPNLWVVGGQQGGPEDLVDEYLATLGGRSASTVDAYGRILRSLAGWVAERPGGSGGFRPDLLTRTAVETHLKELEGRGYSVSHRSRVKSVTSGFAGWLIEEKGLLRKNPTRGVEVPAQALLAPRRLSPDQRYVLKNLVERDGKVRSEALFALGYWAACRVSDASWLAVENAHVGPKVGWVRVGRPQGRQDEGHRPPQRGEAPAARIPPGRRAGRGQPQRLLFAAGREADRGRYPPLAQDLEEACDQGRVGARLGPVLGSVSYAAN